MLEIISGYLEKSAWELTAVILSVAYLVLAMKENIACWLCALFSTLIYTVLFWKVSLKMESALNVYYLIMAVYGFWVWTKGGKGDDKTEIKTWSLSYHLIVILGVIFLSYLSGTFLAHYSTAAWPYLDSFTTWGAVVTTYMVAQKVLENWIYWLVIDGIAVYLYIDRGLYPTAALFVLYLVLVVFGFFAWRKTLAQQVEAGPVPT